MSQPLDLVTQQLLDPAGIENTDVEKTLDQMIVNDIDYADLYFEFSQAESWILEEGIIREGSHSIDQGVGVRAVSEDKTGFAYSDEIILPALTDAAKTARAIAKSGGDKKLNAWQNHNPQERPQNKTGDGGTQRFLHGGFDCK